MQMMKFDQCRGYIKFQPEYGQDGRYAASFTLRVRCHRLHSQVECFRGIRYDLLHRCKL